MIVMTDHARDRLLERGSGVEREQQFVKRVGRRVAAMRGLPMLVGTQIRFAAGGFDVVADVKADEIVIVTVISRSTE